MSYSLDVWLNIWDQEDPRLNMDALGRFEENLRGQGDQGGFQEIERYKQFGLNGTQADGLKQALKDFLDNEPDEPDEPDPNRSPNPSPWRSWLHASTQRGDGYRKDHRRTRSTRRRTRSNRRRTRRTRRTRRPRRTRSNRRRTRRPRRTRSNRRRTRRTRRPRRPRSTRRRSRRLQGGATQQETEGLRKNVGELDEEGMDVVAPTNFSVLHDLGPPPAYGGSGSTVSEDTVFDSGSYNAMRLASNQDMDAGPSVFTTLDQAQRWPNVLRESVSETPIDENPVKVAINPPIDLTKEEEDWLTKYATNRRILPSSETPTGIFLINAAKGLNTLTDRVRSASDVAFIGGVLGLWRYPFKQGSE
jgi:hypothetical protein